MPEEKFPTIKPEESPAEETAKPEEEKQNENPGEVERLEVMLEELERRTDTLIQEKRESELEIEYLKRALEEQKKLATKDPATGLNNRRGLIELFGKVVPAIEGEQEERRREGDRRRKPISALILDIDNFKSINDSHGHNVGDAVLRRFAQFLEKELGLRKSDLVGRWGGEEFVIVFTGAEAQKIINKFYVQDESRAKMGKFKEFTFPSGIAGHEFTVTISGGVADWEPGESLEAVVGRADQALYEAKRTGKDRILNYNEIKDKKG